MGLKGRENNSESWKQWEIDYLIDNYEVMNIKEIMEVLTGRNYVSIVNKMFKIRHGQSKKEIKRYTYNKYVFEEIDDEDKAYWLGFISADGSVLYKNSAYRLQMILCEKDEFHLKKFNLFLDGNINIKIQKYNSYSRAKMIVDSTKLCKDLISLGVIPNKTYSLHIPAIKENLYIHYIRGLFDGDGSLYFNKNLKDRKFRLEISLINYNYDFLTEIRELLSFYNVNSKIYSHKNNWKLGIYNLKDCKAFCKIFYDNSRVYLDRKYKKAIEILNFAV